jgi:hypothetical protein
MSLQNFLHGMSYDGEEDIGFANISSKDDLHLGCYSSNQQNIPLMHFHILRWGGGRDSKKNSSTSGTEDPN